MFRKMIMTEKIKMVRDRDKKSEKMRITREDNGYRQKRRERR